MSKFNETFDNVSADEDLIQNVRKKIEQDKKNSPLPNYEKRPKRRWKPILVTAALILALIMALPSYIMIGNAIRNPRYDFSKALQVKSEKQLSSLLQITKSNPISLDFGMAKGGSDDWATENNMAESPTAMPPAADSENSGGHSTTNVQVEGMDEGDLVKNDGEYIYRLSGSGFSIVRAAGGNLSKVCEIPVENFVPIEMYIRGTQLVLIGGGYKQMPYYDVDDLMLGGYMGCFSYHTNVEIRVFDLTDIENPEETLYYQIEGSYHTSRISEENGTLYFVVNYYNYTYYDNYEKEDGSVKRPYFRNDEDGEAAPLPVKNIYYFKHSINRSYMILGAIDLDDTSKDAQVKAYLSNSGIVYVSGENLYTSTYQQLYTLFGEPDEEVSYIAKFSLSDLGFKGSNSVKGSPKDRYCLDEYEGYLRVATSYRSWTNFNDSASAIYVFNNKMKQVSRITGIAPGEAIDSATFSGDKGYISTSVRMVDPLFIIDFSDVRNPKISQGLKEDGISNYLKAIDGTDYMLGFGTDSDPSISGWNSRTGLKVQLYDMSGEEAVSKEKRVIPGSLSYAEVLYNPKALLYMYDKNTKKGIIGFAAECADYNYDYVNGYININGYMVKEQGFYLYTFDAEAGTLERKGLLSNFDTSKPVLDYSYSQNYDWAQVQDMYTKYVNRGIVIDGYIYTIGNSVITSYNLSTLAKTDELKS